MPITLALVGAGHAHFAVIAQAHRLRDSGVDPVLIAPRTFEYSGLVSGVLSGALPPETMRVDVAALASANDVPHCVAEVTAVDRMARVMTLSDGAALAYDAVSFNIGSDVDNPLGLIDGVWPVKPLVSLVALRRRLEAAFGAGGHGPAIVVAGDGPTSFEVTAALAGLHERHGRPPNVTLVGPDVSARWAPGDAGRALARNLDRRGVRRIAGRITSHGNGKVRLSDNQTLSCDHLVLATGLRGARLAGTLGLPLDDAGRIKVTPTLASLDDSRVFAAGDCAAIEGWPRPFAGVFGVRAAKMLVDNLCALGAGTALRPYRPQDRWLSIMDLGDETGLAMRGRLWWRGPTALWLKRRLDQRFVRRARA